MFEVYVKELKNVIKRGVVIGKSDAISVEDLTWRIQKVAYGPELDISPNKTPFEQKVQNFEEELIIEALENANWVQTKAAELLGTAAAL